MKRFEKGARRRKLWNELVEYSDEIMYGEEDTLFVTQTPPTAGSSPAPARAASGEKQKSGTAAIPLVNG